MKRFYASLLGLLVAVPTVFMAPTMASADTITNPWTWTDISSQLTTRSNRPVWSVAFGSGSWFYTDGQNLRNGGQVYRYDGRTQVNITVDVRNAGLDRVDDIVTDGTTILFLQDITRLDNQLSVVTYRNGQYLNITSQVRSMLQSDEGVNAINGRGGMWYVVTTKSRLFRLNETGVATQITLPSDVEGTIESTKTTMRYSVNHGSMVNGAGRVSLAMVPVANGNWLLMADTWNASPRFFRYNGTTFTETTTLFPVTPSRVYNIVSNGTTALVISDTAPVLTNGTTRATVSGLDLTNINETRIGWNGKSWLVLNKKNLYRVLDTSSSQTAQSLGATRDLFLQMAGDGNGRLLLGGVQSAAWTNGPTTPLTAKLVMVTEGVATPRVAGATDTDNGTFGGDRVYTSTAGPRVTTQGNPANFRVGNGKEFTYRVAATDSNGVSRIDLYVNDALIRTCLSQNTCEFRSAYWTNGDTTRTVTFWTRATDALGNVTVTSATPNALTVDLNAVGGSTGNNGGPDTWDWLDENDNTIAGEDQVVYQVGAWDNDGIERIEIVVNGSVRRTCVFNGNTTSRACSTRMYADQFPMNTDVFVNAKVTDRTGTVSWSTGKTIRVGQADGSSNSGNASIRISADKSAYAYGDSITFTATGSDPDGTDRIEIFVNAVRVKTCTGTRTCRMTMGPFTGIPVITYAATVFGTDGTTASTGYQRINRK